MRLIGREGGCGIAQCERSLISTIALLLLCQYGHSCPVLCEAQQSQGGGLQAWYDRLVSRMCAGSLPKLNQLFSDPLST